MFYNCNVVLLPIYRYVGFRLTNPNPTRPIMEKHCKVKYQIIKEYSEADNTQVISVNGKTYTVKTLPRPTATVSDLFAVFVDGVRYPTFAKFLKSTNQ